MIRLIFGCGYLGLRVAKKWIASGDSVYSITRTKARSDELSQLGIAPIIADVTNPSSLESLPSADTVLFAVGMDRSQYDDIRQVYVEGLQNVLDRLSDSVKHLIYISSTGVYGDFGGDWVDESSITEPTREGGKACLEAEGLIREGGFQSRNTILRFAGIYGPHRVPTRNLIQSRAWDKLAASGYLNLIHVDDGASIVERVANHRPKNETFLVSDGAPALRREYYEFVASQLGVSEIPWAEQPTEQTQPSPRSLRSNNSKRISNTKLLNTFDVRFEYPDYRAGVIQALNKS